MFLRGVVSVGQAIISFPRRPRGRELSEEEEEEDELMTGAACQRHHFGWTLTLTAQTDSAPPTSSVLGHLLISGPDSSSSSRRTPQLALTDDSLRLAVWRVTWLLPCCGPPISGGLADIKQR